MAPIRAKVRAVILSILGIIVALLVLRLILDLVAANRGSFLVKLIYDASDIFINPYNNLFTIPKNSVLSRINEGAISAIIIISLFVFIFTEIITGFLYDTVEEIILNIVDAVFKLIEFIIFLRVIFDFFKFEKDSLIVSRILNLTSWTSNVINVKLLDGRVDLSVILVLVIVVILDLAIGTIASSLLRTDTPPYTETKVFAQPVKQNIYVTVPQPQVQHTFVQPPQKKSVVTKFIPSRFR